MFIAPKALSPKALLLKPVVKASPAALPYNAFEFPVVSDEPALKPKVTFPPGFPARPAGIVIKYADVPSINTSESPLRDVAPPAAGAISSDKSAILSDLVGLPVSLTSVATSKSFVVGFFKVG